MCSADNEHEFAINMRFIWDENKRQANLNKHGLDFSNAEQVFQGPIVVYEDNRYIYNEQRMIAVGLLQDAVVLIVHIELANEIRIISMRKATKNESNI